MSACSCALSRSTRRPDHGRATVSGDRKMSVKIVVERDANPARIPRRSQDSGVLSLSQTDLTYVDCIHAALREQDGRARRP